MTTLSLFSPHYSSTHTWLVRRLRSLPLLALTQLNVLACSSSSPSDGPSLSTGGAANTASGGAASGGSATAGSGGAASGGTPSSASGGQPSVESGGSSNSTGGGGSTEGGGGASTGAGGSEASGGSSSSGGAGSENLPPLSVYIAGDSTVSTYTDTASPSDQAGWGQMLAGVFDERVSVVNRALGGRTAQWFYLEGEVEKILNEAEVGDYFFVQFGTNDSHKTATFTVDGTTYPRYADPNTDFKKYLKDYYLDPSRAQGVIPVLVTPPPRNSAYCAVGNSLGAHAQAMRELGLAEDVIVLDLNQKTYDHLAGICPSPSPEDFFFIKTDGTVDGTHFQENGARHMAEFLGDSIQEQELVLAGYTQKTP